MLRHKEPQNAECHYVECRYDEHCGTIKYARVFVLGRPFQPSVIFVGKARKVASLLKAQALRGWTRLDRGKTFVNYVSKKFYNIGPRTASTTPKGRSLVIKAVDKLWPRMK
jgi:hypothetical protein